MLAVLYTISTGVIIQTIQSAESSIMALADSMEDTSYLEVVETRNDYDVNFRVEQGLLVPIDEE